MKSTKLAEVSDLWLKKWLSATFGDKHPLLTKEIKKEMESSTLKNRVLIRNGYSPQQSNI
jgi:hypothetical protein